MGDLSVTEMFLSPGRPPPRPAAAGGHRGRGFLGGERPVRADVVLGLGGGGGGGGVGASGLPAGRPPERKSPLATVGGDSGVSSPPAPASYWETSLPPKSLTPRFVT